MQTTTSAKLIDILLVEDDPADVLLTREVLQRGKDFNSLSVAKDGVEALAMLRGESEEKLPGTPDLILLDLNMPRMNGREFLTELKSDPALKRLPVVVLTTSDAERDVVSSYELHASCFVTKPVDLDQFTRVVSAIQDFWFAVVRFPES